MPPQTPAQPPAPPTKPEDKLYTPPSGSKFDFIMTAGQKQKRGLTGVVSGLPRSMVILVVVIFSLFGLIFISTFLSSRNSAGTKQLIDIAARQQEIVRVSSLAAELLRDNTALNLEATTETAIASDRAQLLSYLEINRIKVSDKAMLAHEDPESDTKLKAARQSNSAEEAYTAYVKAQLTDYKAALQTAYVKAGPKAQIILQESFDSADLILKDIAKKK